MGFLTRRRVAPGSPGSGTTWVLLFALCSLAAEHTARAQLLSPGKLARPHAELEGLSNCTRCHDVGKKVDGKLCLECHLPVKRAVEAGTGLHGAQAAAGKACFDCHHEHRGEQASLIEWGGARERFDHKRTGYALVDKHAAQKCEKCHEARRVGDSELRKRFGGGSVTYLGLSTRCTSCHFDEHRGQLGADCERCHDLKGFKPASRFRHEVKFALSGGHTKVECGKCHGSEAAPAPAAPFPAPVDSGRFARFTSAAPRRCVDCHRDIHTGKFGRSCDRCHNSGSWIQTNVARVAPTFHDKSRFPLVGKHRAAPCLSCHPARRGGKGMQTTGLTFARCADCHLDAHLGQIAKAADGAVPCQRCHSEEGYFPTRYPVADHQQTAFPLLGAHALVACNRCHKAEPEYFAAALPARLKPSGAVAKRTELLNFTRLKFRELDLKRCNSCHADPHRGQFNREGDPGKSLSRDDPRPCDRCHTVDSFKRLTFDHNRDSHFKLDGKHASATCAACHKPRADGAVGYLDTPTHCAGCHADVHAGQFVNDTGKSLTTDIHAAGSGCERCHDTAGFKPARFGHDNPAQVSFALKGKHQPLSCDRCHPKLALADPGKSAPVDGGAAVTWYRGVPRRCDGCHVDPHRDRSIAVVAAAEPVPECTRCHSESGWHDVTFDHEQTRFPLRGRHSEQDCRVCHAELHELALDSRCQGCHQDPHSGRLGQQCERCHDQRSWSSGAGVLAHSQTRFALTGRHAMVPCEECHRARTDRTFGGAPIRCASCHQVDLQRVAGGGLDHAAFGLTPDCRRCHEPIAWRRALLPDHERCFPLLVGHHRGIRCQDCHQAINTLAVSNCATFNAACTRCHGCSGMDQQHREKSVAGYQCADRKCYECHPTGGTE